MGLLCQQVWSTCYLQGSGINSLATLIPRTSFEGDTISTGQQVISALLVNNSLHVMSMEDTGRCLSLACMDNISAAYTCQTTWSACLH